MALHIKKVADPYVEPCVASLQFETLCKVRNTHQGNRKCKDKKIKGSYVTRRLIRNILSKNT